MTVDGLPPVVIGGIQTYALELSKALAAHGVRVSLLYGIPYRSDQQLEEDPFADYPHSGSSAYPVQRRKPGRLPGHYLKDSFHLSARMLTCSQEVAADADFVYAHGQTGRAFIKAKLNGCRLPPICVHAHGYEMFQTAPSFRGRLEQYLLGPTFARMSREADYVFSYGGKIDRILAGLGVSADRILQTPNGIGADWLKCRVVPEVREKRHFLFVGRFERRKGIQEIHAAIRQIPVGRAVFRFVGPVPEAMQLRRSDVFYDGLVRDTERLKQIYDASDVMLCPSHSEGMPTVVLLAMARGLAVIATDVGAVAAVVSEENGILLPGPSAEGLRDAIEAAIGWSADELLGRQRESMERSRDYTWDAIAAETLQSFENILATGKSGMPTT